MAKITAKSMAELQKEVQAEMKRRCGYGSLAEFGKGVIEDISAGTEITAEQASRIIEPLMQINDSVHMRALPSKGAPIKYNIQEEAKKFLDKISKEPITGSQTSCRAQCSGLCVSTCYSSCTGCTGCSNTCGSGCASGCISCTGTCTATCGNNCGKTCSSGCGKGCDIGCTSTCKGCSACGGCSGCSGCGSNCDKSCIGCTGSCKNTCYGCSGCGGCAGVS